MILEFSSVIVNVPYLACPNCIQEIKQKIKIMHQAYIMQYFQTHSKYCNSNVCACVPVCVENINHSKTKCAIIISYDLKSTQFLLIEKKWALNLFEQI